MDEWKLQPARDLGLSLGERWRSLRRESGLIETAAHVLAWTIVQPYLAVCHRLAIHGREHLPAEPPFVLVANHASHLDALVLASSLPWWMRDRVFPIAAGDTFFETPVVAAFAAGVLNALPMWRRRRGPHALEQLRQRLLDEPCAYILFPEGTRSRTGTMAPFRAGLGMLVAETPVSVIPCYLHGTFQALPPDRRWPRLGRITLRIGAGLIFSSVPNDRGGWEKIAAATEAAVRYLAGQAV